MTDTPSVPMSRWQAFREFTGKVARLTAPYFSSEEKWKARGLLAAIVALNLGAVYMLVLINEWNRVFYDALQNKDAEVFWRELGRFTYLAFGFILIAVYRFYLTQLLEMRWRAWMTGHYMDRWLGQQAFYQLELQRHARGTDAPPDNPDQRIAEDMNLFTSYSVSLSMGLLNAVVTLVSFVGILWSLSGSFAFNFQGQTWDIPGFMVWMAVVYCVLGSVITHYIGRPQIGLNFRQQRFEADFRHHLVRVREYSESIALDRGEPVERRHLGQRFQAVLANYLQLINAQKRLTWFTVGFGQAAVVFPFIVAAPRFFSGAIQLGELIQIASAFGRVQDALSWFVDNYSSLAAWRATTDRITSFEESFQALAAAPASEGVAVTPAGPSDGLSIDRLDLALPGGVALVGAAGLRLRPGDRPGERIQTAGVIDEARAHQIEHPARDRIGFPHALADHACRPGADPFHDHRCFNRGAASGRSRYHAGTGPTVGDLSRRRRGAVTWPVARRPAARCTPAPHHHRPLPARRSGGSSAEMPSTSACAGGGSIRRVR